MNRIESNRTKHCLADWLTWMTTPNSWLDNKLTSIPRAHGNSLIHSLATNLAEKILSMVQSASKISCQQGLNSVLNSDSEEFWRVVSTVRTITARFGMTQAEDIERRRNVWINRSMLIINFACRLSVMNYLICKNILSEEILCALFANQSVLLVVQISLHEQ